MFFLVIHTEQLDGYPNEEDEETINIKFRFIRVSKET